MFYIYANGKSIYQPMDKELVLFSPKLTLEIGKAGSLTFQIPQSNKYYNSLSQLTTIVTVEMDDTEIFRGRVLTNNRNFNNIRTIYCEGDLAYLVDSVQKAEKYDGGAHALFRKIIAAHNARVEAGKRFTVGNITVENRNVLLTGDSEEIENAETGEFDYRQIAINSIVDEWQNTFDFIESCLISYTGGYLRTRRVGNTTYIDLLKDYGTTSTQEIEFGKNMLDLSEEVSPEELFTVLIPLGDENLTIESVNNGSDELVDYEASRLYGRIVRTHVFDSVTDPNTLLENGRRYLNSKANVPVTLTVKAVDMHLVDSNARPIYIGDKVYVNSAPHGMADQLTCTKIEYDMENPANNTYTFGNPIQTLTQRYRKDKIDQDSEESHGGGGGGAGGGAAGQAADAEAKKQLDEFFDAWINVDPDAAHIDLGTLYKKFKDGVEILESYCGISIDAPSGNINIKTLRKEFDELGNLFKEQSAYIDLLNNELGARIDLVASQYLTLSDLESTHYAELLLFANEHESKIVAHTESIEKLNAYTTESRTNITQLSNRLDAQISLEAEHKKLIDGQLLENKTSIKEVADELSAQIKLETSHKTELDSKIQESNTIISQISNALEAQIQLEASHKTELEGKITSANTSITQVADDLKAQISLEASHKMELEGKITSANTSITQVANDLKAQISLEAQHHSDQGTTIASIRAKANKNESNITLKANKTYVDSEILSVTGKIEAAEAKILSIEAIRAEINSIVATKIDSVTADISWLTAKSISLDVGLYAPYVRASKEMTLNSKAVATQEWTNSQLNGYATQSWVTNKGYLTGIPSSISATSISASSSLSLNGQAVATRAWVTGLLEKYAKKNHSHAWSEITSKPSSFTPTKHRHSMSFKIANGHTHKVTVSGTSYTSKGVSTNATHKVSTNTGYYP